MGFVFSQRDFWFLRKDWETSSVNISTELGSSGAAPPLGEATTISTLGDRTSWGCANSGYWAGSMSVCEYLMECDSPVRTPRSWGHIDATHQVPSCWVAVGGELVRAGEDDENFGSHCECVGELCGCLETLQSKTRSRMRRDFTKSTKESDSRLLL